MDINKVDSQDLANALEQLHADKGQAASAKDASISAAAALAVDSYDSESFTAVKAEVASAKDPARAAYIDALKESVKSGLYDVDTDTLADAILNGGYGEVLVS